MGKLTPEQVAEKIRWEELTPAQKGQETKEKKAKESAKQNNGFVNPFTAGVTYEAFVKELKGQSVASYCAGSELTKDEINWISDEIENFKKK